MIAECIEESGTGPSAADVETVVSRFARENDIPGHYHLHIIYLSAEDIREYKKRMFGIDEVTDVISVLMEEDFDGSYLWAEIYVCSDRAEQESAKRTYSKNHELLLYIVHGLFHLIGYEDGTEEQRREMWDVQLSFLDRCGFSPDAFVEGS